MKIKALRVIHGLFALYFLACLAYVYYAGITATFDAALLIAMVSLAIEGFIVFAVNEGDCPLIHIQRVVGDDTPFFELFFPPATASRAIPFFAALTWGGVALVIIRAYLHVL